MSLQAPQSDFCYRNTRSKKLALNLQRVQVTEMFCSSRQPKQVAPMPLQGNFAEESGSRQENLDTGLKKLPLCQSILFSQNLDLLGVIYGKYCIYLFQNLESWLLFLFIDPMPCYTSNLTNPIPPTTRLTYNCAHLRSTKESLTLEGSIAWYLVVLGQYGAVLVDI